MDLEESNFWKEECHDGKFRWVGKATICTDKPEVKIGDITNAGQGGKISVWIFDNVEEFMPGDSGNVFRLCEQYFLALKWLVQEWLKQRKALGLI